MGEPPEQCDETLGEWRTNDYFREGIKTNLFSPPSCQPPNSNSSRELEGKLLLPTTGCRRMLNDSGRISTISIIVICVTGAGARVPGRGAISRTLRDLPGGRSGSLAESERRTEIGPRPAATTTRRHLLVRWRETNDDILGKTFPSRQRRDGHSSI